MGIRVIEGNPGMILAPGVLLRVFSWKSTEPDIFLFGINF